ncbi:SEL1-like repeat protein [Aquimarina sp. TRL1]|uniref:tetratricopeptide repeat protein n=1 Tax=Aquimarina sp. (strain TRL1) TaxID=2736252 RepID=UPI00158F042E|nr:SEL1-like repeat protein [Aquimarina sp. TRL1]QKX06099.1 SEL1-like repeat protein [Aquimarina sp. TRL1]
MTHFEKAQKIQQKILRGDLEVGILNPKEIETMVTLYTKAKDAKSWYELGMIYYKGIGVEQDAEKAVYFFELAATSGYGIDAWIKYIKIAYFAKLDSIPPDKIIKLIEQLKDKDPTGEIYLLKGYMLYMGYVYEDNEKVSYLMHQKSAEKGNAEAMFELFIYYSQGIGVEVNLEKAIEWCRKASEHNNPRAMYNLGAYYATGYQSIPVDIQKTISFYTKAANLGHGKAAGQLAAMYVTGEEVDKDDTLAKKFYLLALENGYEVDFLFEDLGLKTINIDD